MASAQPAELPRSDAARDLLASRLRSTKTASSSSASSAKSIAISRAMKSGASERLEEARMALAKSGGGSGLEASKAVPTASDGDVADLAGRTTAQSADLQGDGNSSSTEKSNEIKVGEQGQPTATPLPPVEPHTAPIPLTEAELADAHFKIPHKRIVSPASLRRWEHSQAFDEVLGFVMFCNDAVVGRKLSEDFEQSSAAKALLSILDTVDDVVRQTPAETGSSSRFGNPAFRTFYARVKEQSRELHQRIPRLGDIKGQRNSVDGGCDAIGEIETYFIESFGNEKRIDYGSGMELNFLCWIICLVKLRVFDLEKEAPTLVLRIFWRYVEVMRNIQSTYWLEPAGSHGVWGLDDYHFLPFLFGSAQLKGHKYLKPKSIHDQEILDEFSKDYMYFACIRFINSIKTASLRWHSPMLDDISGVKKWDKVNEGMLKMYKAEVMLKLPIAQHIFFGSLLPFPTSAADDEERDDGLKDEEAQRLAKAVENGGVVHEDAQGNVHVHGGGAGQGAAANASGWGDCCGIPIPSAFAAAQEERTKAKGAGGLRFEGSSSVRRIPFD